MRSIVRSLRIHESLWKRFGKLARGEGKTRNAELVALISDYCEKKAKKDIDKAK